MGCCLLRISGSIHSQFNHHVLQFGARVFQIDDIADVGQRHDQLHGFCDRASVYGYIAWNTSGLPGWIFGFDRKRLPDMARNLDPLATM